MTTDSPMVRMIAAAADFERQMRRVTEALARVDWPQLQRLVDLAEGYDQHHPRPLPINGHEYARRRRNR
ncbi:hypothetical protein [Nocardioides sp.]|uniref:hypothetical protein n=1 Tax=Nocardioides sp. TaxID=35761 RepID=UPI0035B49864